MVKLPELHHAPDNGKRTIPMRDKRRQKIGISTSAGLQEHMALIRLPAGLLYRAALLLPRIACSRSEVPAS